MLGSVPRGAQSTLTLALLLVCQASFAVVGTPVLVPPHPVAGQLVQVSVYSGGCDTFSTYPSPTVIRAGDKIRIDLPGVFTVDQFCIFPFGDSLFPVGTFQPGNYSLIARMSGSKGGQPKRSQSFRLELLPSRQFRHSTCRGPCC